jgi:RHS repeat-associated protein
VDRPADEGGAINLTWTPSTATGITQQRVYRSTTSGGPYSLAATINNNTVNAHTDTGLTNGTTYYYVVRAFNGTSESANSNQAGAAAIDNTAPLAPTQLTAADNPRDQGGKINLSWTVSTSTDVTHQRIYRATGSGGPYTLISNIPNNTTSSHTDQAATANTTYYYIVRAYDGTQESINSVEVSGVSVNNVLASYVYDEATSTNAKGKLTTVNDSSGTTKFFYDNMGRIKQTDKTVDGTLFSTSTTFDLAGRTKSVTYPDADVVFYSYDGPVLSKVSKDAAGTINYATYAGHNALGQVGTVTFGNGVVTSYTYSNAANGVCPKDNFRLCNITTKLGTAKYQDLTYSYDNNGLGVGNITGITDGIATDTSPPPGIKHTNQTQTFGYNDSLNRLTNASGPYGTITYAYDKLGNMTCNSFISSCTASSSNYTYGDLAHRHAVTHIGPSPGGVNYAYDANGNMIGRGSDILKYDVQGRLTTVTNAGGATTFVYDGDGGRVKKMNGSVTNIYIGKLWECTLSASATSCKSGSAWSSANVKHIFAGSARIAIKPVTTTNEIKYFHADHLGTTSVVTDQTGGRGAEYVYRPYGNELLSAGGDFRYKYTGQEEDGETGLYFYNARYYDPVLARFISPDSVVPDLGNPQAFNRYSYVYNNPLIYTDPTGHCPVCFIAAGIVMGALSAGVQSDWNMEAMIVGGAIGGISGGAGAAVSSAVGGGIIGGFYGGMAGGMVGGGIYSAYYGGNVIEGMGMGAAFGAAGGMLTAGVGNYYGDNWTLGRVFMHGAIGGGLSEIASGDFRTGFSFSAGAALAMWAWDYTRYYTNKSSLQGMGKHVYDDTGELRTDGTRVCIGCTRENQNWFTRLGQMAPEGSENNKVFGISYKVGSRFGEFVNMISKSHDFMNSWRYLNGNYIAGNEFFETLFQIYNASGMIPAAIFTGFAFSALNYQPPLYIYGE